MKVIYLIGSLRNAEVPVMANKLRDIGFEVFDDWHAASENADDCWRDYSKGRGQTYKEALDSYAGIHIFEFDKHHLDRCDIAVMVMKAGKSGHLEAGYVIGQGKPCFYLMEEGVERWDVMLRFCKLNGGDVCSTEADLIEKLKAHV